MISYQVIHQAVTNKGMLAQHVYPAVNADNWSLGLEKATFHNAQWAQLTCAALAILDKPISYYFVIYYILCALLNGFLQFFRFKFRWQICEYFSAVVQGRTISLSKWRTLSSYAYALRFID